MYFCAHPIKLKAEKFTKACHHKNFVG